MGDPTQSDLERELAGADAPAITIDDIPNLPLEGVPTEDEPEQVWATRTPERVIQLPYLFKMGDEWTREIELRKMDGFAEDLMGDDSGTYQDRHNRMDEVLSRCCERIGSTSRPTSDPRDKDGVQSPKFFAKAFGDMTLANRIMAVIRLRQLSTHLPTKGMSGHKFRFSDTCPFDGCKKLIENAYCRLDTLPVTQVPDDVCKVEKQVYDDGEYKIEWRFALGKDEPKLHRIREERRDALLSGYLLVQILTINGTKPTKFEDIKRLPKSVRDAMRDAIDLGGIDITIKVECPFCRREYARPLPWEQKGFFFPSRQQ